MDINIWLGIILLLILQTHFVFSDNASVLHGKNLLRTVDGVNISAQALTRREFKITDNLQTYQRRIRFDVNFNKRWLHYRNGFGTSAGDFWLGLKHMHNLTKSGKWELRIDMRYNNVNYYAQYRSFKIGSESEYFPLRVSGFSGNVKDELKRHNGYRFYTIDYPGLTRCAAYYLAGWWFHNCHDVFLNGEQPRRRMAGGIHWYSLTGDNSNLQSVEMKIRKQ
ncbi:fibrinogen C domain-containing protein 1-like [Physella acuta]|uniref:fibrinogen C domain-containing protein 1-like n=1 Tax=Physella acuta TaxID=109671 RepID=UPI0027DDEF3D|nr:fibrinogen C domain-containing protein 1-like [Physella acuta]